MDQNLLKTGEFARFTRSTKRTVQWYDQKGILKPSFIDEKGYKFYKPEQIIDFQVILLLKKLNFSLTEIKSFLSQNTSLKELFSLKQKVLADEIKHLQKSLSDVNSYYQNLESRGLLINPKIKKVSSFPILCLEKEGPYSKIYQYSLELKSMFKRAPKDITFLAVFLDPEFKPKKSKIKVAVVNNGKIKIKKEFENIVKREVIPSYKVLSYTHQGSPALLSLLWKELEKYRDKHNFKQNYNLPFAVLEFYRTTALNGEKDEEFMVCEINLPIV